MEGGDFECLDPSILENVEKVLQIKEKAERLYQTAEDFYRKLKAYLEKPNPLILSLLLEEPVSLEGIPEVYLTKNGKLCFTPFYLKWIVNTIKEGVTDLLNSLNSGCSNITIEDFLKFLVAKRFRSYVEDIRDGDDISPLHLQYFSYTAKATNSLTLNLEEAARIEKEFTKRIENSPEETLPRVDRLIEEVYNSLKSLHPFSREQIIFIVSQIKGVRLNPEERKTKRIFTTVKRVLTRMEELNEELFSEIVEPLSGGKLGVPRRKRGDPKDVYDEIERKLNVRGKVFELTIDEEEILFRLINNPPSYDDIGGYTRQKDIIKKWNPKKGIRSLSLIGLPGTGKTTLAIAKAAEYARKNNIIGVVIKGTGGRIVTPDTISTIFSLLSEINEDYFGFKENCIVVLDDAEDLFKRETRRETLNYLEKLMKGDSSPPVIITSNDYRLFKDEALYGRLGFPVLFNNPTEEERRDIFYVLSTRKYPLNLDESMTKRLAKETEGFSGRFIEKVFQYATQLETEGLPLDRLLKGIDYVKTHIIAPLNMYRGIGHACEADEEVYI